MTVQELIQAKQKGQTITGPFGDGKVNSIGQTHTYIYYPGSNGLRPMRVIETPNDEIAPKHCIKCDQCVFDTWEPHHPLFKCTAGGEMDTRTTKTVSCPQ